MKRSLGTFEDKLVPWQPSTQSIGANFISTGAETFKIEVSTNSAGYGFSLLYIYTDSVILQYTDLAVVNNALVTWVSVCCYDSVVSLVQHASVFKIRILPTFTKLKHLEFLSYDTFFNTKLT